jgi:hypothetical protein
MPPPPRVLLRGEPPLSPAGAMSSARAARAPAHKHHADLHQQSAGQLKRAVSFYEKQAAWRNGTMTGTTSVCMMRLNVAYRVDVFRHRWVHDGCSSPRVELRRGPRRVQWIACS